MIEVRGEGAFLARNGAGIAAGSIGLLMLFAVVWFVVTGGHGAQERKAPEITMVKIDRPEEKPPPPKTEPEQDAQKPVERQDMNYVKPQETVQPPAGATLADEGPGGGFDIAASTGRGGLVGNGRGGGSYTGVIQAGVSQALRANRRTQNARIEALVVKLWIDRSGRITGARLIKSTGVPELDAVIERNVLVGLLLSAPPPEDMELPVSTRITIRAPG